MIMREHETASDMAGKCFWGHCSRHTMAVKVRGRGIGKIRLRVGSAGS